MTDTLPVIRFEKLAASHIFPEQKKHNIPILFIHGAWGGKYQFTKWMRLAAREGWESYALDLRGHGESVCENFGKVSMEDYAKDIETVAGRIGPCYAVGQSLGGLALQLAASRSASIQKAVFAASAPPAGIFARFRFKSRVLHYLLKVFSGKPIAIEQNDAIRFLFNYSPALNEFDFNALESPRAIRDIGLWRVRVTSLLCSSLVVAAEKDPAVPPCTERAIAKKYGSDYVEIEDIGHMLMMEEGWEQPISEILRWLGKDSARDGLKASSAQ